MDKRLSKQVDAAVGLLENLYLDNPAEEPVTLEEAVGYCYDELLGYQRGAELAARFEGAPAIREALKQAIISNAFIKLKEDY